MPCSREITMRLPPPSHKVAPIGASALSLRRDKPNSDSCRSRKNTTISLFPIRGLTGRPFGISFCYCVMRRSATGSSTSASLHESRVGKRGDTIVVAVGAAERERLAAFGNRQVNLLRRIETAHERSLPDDMPVDQHLKRAGGL